jgi:hypothetical protein
VKKRKRRGKPKKKNDAGKSGEVKKRKGETQKPKKKKSDVALFTTSEMFLTCEFSHVSF